MRGTPVEGTLSHLPATGTQNTGRSSGQYDLAASLEDNQKFFREVADIAEQSPRPAGNIFEIDHAGSLSAGGTYSEGNVDGNGTNRVIDLGKIG